MRRAWRLLKSNLLLQFILVSALGVAAVGLLLTVALAQQTMGHSLEEAEGRALNVVQNCLPCHISSEDFTAPLSQERYKAIDGVLARYVLALQAAGVKIWDHTGRVVYSTDPSQVGQTYPVREELARALAGGIGKEISVP